jgi:hypothetical protein
MRQLAHSDLVTLARRLTGIPEDRWDTTVSQSLYDAHAADCYRKRFGRAHPVWGNGSLSASIRMRDGGLMPEPFLTGTQYLRALGKVIEGVIQWRSRV